MCIIICAPQGRQIPGKHLKNSLRNNRDGWGLMWAEKGVLQILTGMSDAEFWKSWKWVKDIKSSKVFHARIGTHGKKNLDNCHPFAVPGHGNLGVAHNGIISHTAYTNSDKSDTKHFVDDVLAGLPIGFEKMKGCQELISKYISYGKMVFMDGNGDFTIVNAEKGEWVSGCWYSNAMWRNSLSGNKFPAMYDTVGGSSAGCTGHYYGKNNYEPRVWSERAHRFVTVKEKEAEIDDLIDNAKIATTAACTTKPTAYLEDKTKEVLSEISDYDALAIIDAQIAEQAEIDTEIFTEDDIVAEYEKACERESNPQSDFNYDDYYLTRSGAWEQREVKKQDLDMLSDTEWCRAVSDRKMGFKPNNQPAPLTGTMSASEYKRKLAEAKEDIAIHNDHIQDHWDAVTGLAAKKATPKTEEVAPIFPCKLPDIYDKPPF